MSPELHQRVRKLFDEAMEKPESERPAFLETACGGDQELRQAVERLLEAHRDAVKFLASERRAERRMGRYIISRELGRGAMGVVYEGIDPLIGRSVAVKVIRPDSLAEPGKTAMVRDQLFREAHSAGRLLHPGIVVIFDVGEEGDSAFIAMELVEGRSLADMLSADHVPPVHTTLEILRQAAAALDYAHQNGIVHRDIKPANIMLHKGNAVKIADFGVAKISSLQFRTATGIILGTPSYMSPEQIEMRPLDGRADQFSLAVVAYEMLTGNRPFEADSLATLAHLIVYAERPSARAANPALSEAADKVLRRALARAAGERYGSCGEFVGALVDALSEAPRPPIPATALPPAPRPPAPPAPVPQAPPAPPPAHLKPVSQAPVPQAPSAPSPAALTPVPPPPARPAPISQPPAAAARAAISPAPQAPVRPAPVARSAPPAAAPPARRAKPPAVWIAAGLIAVGVLAAVGGWIYQTQSESIPRGVAGPEAAPYRSGAAPYRPEAPPDRPEAPPDHPAPAGPAPVPHIVQFKASSDSIMAGSSALLHWQVTDASEVRIDPGPGRVDAAASAEVKPTQSTTYTLTANGLGGRKTASLSIAVTAPAEPTQAERAAQAYQAGLAERKAGHNDKALADFRLAAALNDVKSMLELADSLIESSDENDIAEAIRWFRKAGEMGDATAMLHLGAIYELGEKVQPDYELAAFWYRKASEKGNASAAYNLGRLYENGKGVNKDLARAKELYQRAADRGNPEGRIRLSQLSGK